MDKTTANRKTLTIHEVLWSNIAMPLTGRTPIAFPLTVIWTLVYLSFLALGGVDSVGWLNNGLVVPAVAMPLTVLLFLEWGALALSRKAAILVALCGLLFWGITAYFIHSTGDWRFWQTLNTVALLGTTFTAGSWLAEEILEPVHLIPVCIVAAAVDILSVMFGPSAKLGEHVIFYLENATRNFASGLPLDPPPALNLLLLHWPRPGTTVMAPLLGVGDLVFIAFFLGACRRFELPLFRATFLLLLGLGISLLLAQFFHKPMPVLPFICGLFLLGNLPALRTRSS
ncbi:MAG: hypothetical protein JRJ12_16985 [Deltaproteobacteria bacterium]|nr:hypothetical protein [Deltaproteobacteria bacterium]MBW2072959.1 hypothetical protein [Deltaproteobacteria bacterium]